MYAEDGDIFAIDSTGGRPERILGGTAEDEAPSYSRDGRWIYFTSRRTGRPEIWRMPRGGGEPQQITAEGGYAGIESHDGRKLFFLRDRDRQTHLHMMPANGGTAEQVAETIPWRVNLAITESGLYFIPGGNWDAWASIMLFDPGRRTTTKVLDLPKRTRSIASGLSVTSDGRQFAFSAYDLEGDLMMVDNFQ